MTEGHLVPSRTWAWRGLFMAGALFLGAPGRDARAGETPSQSVSIDPEVVVRVSGKPIVYLPAASGGLEAIDGTNGKRLWHSSAASQPLLVRDGRLLAIATAKATADPLRLTLLAADTGDPGGEMPALPAGAMVGETPDARGFVEGRSGGRGDAIFWSTTRLPAPAPGAPTGTPPSAGAVSQGALAVDLAARTLTPTDERLPELRTKRVDEHGKAVLEIAPFEVDGIHVQILTVPRPAAPAAAVIRRSKGGQALPDVVVENWSPRFPVIPSTDHRHVLQIHRNEFGGGPWAVQVYAVATGDVIATFNTDDLPWGFVVVGRRIYYRSFTHALVDQAGARDLEKPDKPIFVRPIKKARQ
jgi:hypothetical protein